MNILLAVKWWLHLDYQFDVGNVNAPGSDVCGYQYLRPLRHEIRQYLFPVNLWHILAHAIRIINHGHLFLNIQTILPSVGEDEYAATLCVFAQNFCQGTRLFELLAFDGDVFYVLIRFIFQVTRQINLNMIRIQIFLNNFTVLIRQRSGEK